MKILSALRCSKLGTFRQSPTDVEPSLKSFFLWHSLLKGRDIMNMGATQRVGDGRSINVWKDKWIPCLSNGCPSLLGVHSLTHMNVSYLINLEKRVRHEEMVYEMFHSEEAEMVMSIPLSKMAIPDKLIWTESIVR